ncbi:hypothetical protein [Aeromonas sp. QDB20]|uniref:hypothetical protein n=1 Tax=Aeromonas sp. QDB20 TaxID=2989835 RepID=UPI0022E7E5E3|nr:hypothetical protein [Aeromonas sp. QDB20]HDZ8981171.1 hypothetical protein [Aeromonas veronii]
MTTKKYIDPKIKEYLQQIKKEYQPDPSILQQRIDLAILRHPVFIECYDHGHIVMVDVQNKILEGYRYEPSPHAFYSSGLGMCRIRLNKPAAVVESELHQLRSEIEEEYRQEIEREIENRVNQLIAEAAAEREALAAQQAADDRASMARQLKEFLLS